MEPAEGASMPFDSRRIKDFLQNRVPMGGDLLANLAVIRTDIKTILKRSDSWQAEESKWPRGITIEVTNVCNVDCVFCAYRYQENFRAGRGFVSESHFRHCVDIHAQMGGRFVGLCPIVGEPLLDRTILNKIEYVVEKGMETSFHTNGVRLKYIDQKRLLNCGIKSISLSTAPFDKKLFESIFRSNHYDDLLVGVRNLLTLRNETKTDFSLLLSFRSNLSYSKTLKMPDFRRLIWPLLSDNEREIIVVNSFDNWGGQIKREDLLPGMRLKPSNRVKRLPCKWTFFPLISWDGKVRACACRFRGDEKIHGDDLVVGDLQEKGLDEIWNSQSVKSLHRRFTIGDVPRVCRDCSMYDPC
jgi:radical SAM protein with 4Fe4S-binding SPASM domain